MLKDCNGVGYKAVHEPSGAVAGIFLVTFPGNSEENLGRDIGLSEEDVYKRQEVRMAIDKVRSYPGVKSLAITCDKDSALYNDFMILSPDTAEDSVIMTRSFTSMVYLAAVMAMYVGGKKDEIAAMAGYGDHARDALKKMDEMAKRIITEHEGLNLFITLGPVSYTHLDVYKRQMKNEEREGIMMKKRRLAALALACVMALTTGCRCV